MSVLALRRLTLADLDACLALAQERDWRPEAERWRLLFDVGEVYGCDSPHGGLAATGVLTRYGTAGAAISMLLTAQRHERQGLGGRIMRHLIGIAGTRSVFLTATKFGLPLYERLGFRTVGETSTLAGEYRPAPSWTSRPATAADLPAITALDAAATGLPRGPLLAHLLGGPASVRVVDGPDGLAGYGFSWHNLDETVLGPISATGLETARALFDDLASEAEDKVVRVDADHRQPGWVEHLRGLGLAHRFSTKVMEYGDPVAGDPRLAYTMASLALG